MTETDLQKSVVQWLILVKPRALWFHVPNESKAHVSYRKKMKEMGVLAGVGDFVFVMDRGRVGFIELKYGNNKQSKSQLAFEETVIGLGALYEVARSIEEVEGILKAWGALKQKAAPGQANPSNVSPRAVYGGGGGV